MFSHRRDRDDARWKTVATRVAARSELGDTCSNSRASDRFRKMFTRAARTSAIRCLLIVTCIVMASPFLLPVALRAQTIAGTVQSAGSPIVGATVRLLELDRIEHTGAQGQFTFSDVPKGTYRVYVGVTGYASVTDTVKVMSEIARISIDLRKSA